MRISDWSSDVCSSDLVADALRVEEIELHETFDRALPRPLGELHALRDLALDIEGQPVLGAPGEDVEVTAHGEQELLRPRELPQPARREQSRVDLFPHRAHAVAELADPAQGMPVPKPPLPFLPLRFADLARPAPPPAP